MNYVNKLTCICMLLLLSITASSQCITGKRVESFSGDSILYSCPQSINQSISFKAFTYSTQFVYIIADKKDTIRKISTTGLIDFKGLNDTEYHVFGYSIKGTVQPILGKYIYTTRITDLCFGRSINYITVFRNTPVAPVLNAQSMSPIIVCAPDGRPDFISLNATFPTKNKSSYVVVDELQKIVRTSDQNSINADNLTCTICKVYAVSYTGNFVAKIGDSFGNPLSDDCQAASVNFITLVRTIPKGGEIAFPGQNSTLFICSASKQPQIITASINNNSSGYQRFIITDTLNKVLAVNESPLLPTTALSLGYCRIWGLTFTGIVDTNVINKSIHTVAWTNDCYALTANYISILKQLPDAGQISLGSANSTQTTICKDNLQDLIDLRAVNSKGAKTLWVFTDPVGSVVSWTNAATFDFNTWPIGVRKVYHLAYTGNLTLKVGDLITSPASDDCFDYSKSFLSITVDVPRAGALSFTDQTNEKFVCANVPSELAVNIIQSGQSALSNTYLLADSSGRFLTAFGANQFDFAGRVNAVYRIYSLSYSGDISLKLNDSISQAVASTGCYQISKDYLRVIKGEAKAGKITFESGKDSLLLCSTQNLIAARFKSSQISQTAYVYVLTSAQDTVVRILKTDTFNLTNAAIGICKFWGLAYTGTLLLKPGDYIKKGGLATGCADLTAQPLVLIKDKPVGGRVAFKNVDTVYQICYRDGWPDLLNLHHSGSSMLPYQFVATNAANQIIAFNVRQTNLESLPSDISRIYGVSYLGPILAALGDDITKAIFAADCFELSSNFIQISGETINAGIIRTDKNLDILNYCIQSTIADTIKLAVNGATPSVKYYYIGIQSDSIKFISSTGILFSGQLPAGETQIYGIAYKGNFIAKAGDKLSTQRLTDSCFGVSTNSIVIRKFAPEAGSVVGIGPASFYLCPGDGQSDFVALTPSKEAPLPYAYLVADQNDKILAVSVESVFDLDTFRLGTCRIFGLSYKGTIQAIGKNISSPDLATDCFDVSEDYVGVIKAPADAGRVSNVAKDTVISICVEDLAADTIRFINNSNAGLKYAYLVTDVQNRLQRVIESANQPLDFNGSDPGVCRIYGVSYGGILTVFRNDNVTSKSLASGCYDLSDNFILLNKSNTGGLCKNIGVDPKNTIFLAAYPNPATDVVNIQLKSKFIKSGNPELFIVDASGSLLEKIILPTQMIDNQNIEINTSALKAGLYFIMFKNGYIFDRIKVVILK